MRRKRKEKKNVMGQVNEPNKAWLGLNINKLLLEAWLSRGLTDLSWEVLLSTFYLFIIIIIFPLSKFLIFILLK